MDDDHVVRLSRRNPANRHKCHDLPSSALSDLQGDELARAYMSRVKAFEITARSPVEYSLALPLARRACEAALPAGLMHTWALNQVAGMAADLGRYDEAEEAATAFLRYLPSNPKAVTVAALVYSVLGRVRAWQGRHQAAVTLFRQALTFPCQPELGERIQLMLTRSLGRLGRLREAFEACPASVAHVDPSKISSAQAVLYAAMGSWSEARTLALSALAGYRVGAWRALDIVELAELLLILRQAALATHSRAEAGAWLIRTTIAVLGVNRRLLLVPIPRSEGGVRFDAEVSRCGPAGHKRTGLRGCVG